MSTRTTNTPLPNIPTVFSRNVNLLKKLTNQHACCFCCGVKFRAISFPPLLILRCVSGVHDYFVFTFNAFLYSPLSTIVLFVCLSLFELRLLISVLVSSIFFFRVDRFKNSRRWTKFFDPNIFNTCIKKNMLFYVGWCCIEKGWVSYRKKRGGGSVLKYLWSVVGVMVFNATFNNISAISWRCCTRSMHIHLYVNC